MERVADQEQTAEVFENDISMYLTLFCEENGIEDMTKESQSRWNAALMFIRKHVFPDRDILKSHINHDKGNSIMESTYNSYDYDLVDSLCDYYIYLCMINDKEVSGIGFSLLSGIDRDTIRAWRNEGRVLSSKSNAIAQKIYDFREESLSAKLATANKNPVGILAILNRHYQWNLPGVSREKTESRALSAAELPRLGDMGADAVAEIPKNRLTIAQKEG